LSLGRKSATERLATFLLEVAEQKSGASCDQRNDAPLEFELLMARRVIGDYLGLSVECVSRKVQQLARDGVISVREHDHITIQDFRALRRLSGD
jgi:CRP/FNR family transcriptional regulator